MSVKLTSYIEPTSTAIPFILEDKYVKGGHRTVADYASRDAISTGSRKVGMMVYVSTTDEYFALRPTITTWELVPRTIVQQTVIDTNQNASMVVGAFGLGATAVPIQDDLNNYTHYTGFLRGSGLPNSPFPGLVLVHVLAGAEQVYQTVYDATTGVAKERFYASNTWSSWYTKYSEANLLNIGATASTAKTALQLTSTDVGLGNVSNTSDATKPVSVAQQTALDLKADKTYVDTSLTAKANVNDMNTALVLKADKTYVDTSIAGKADTSTVAAKADTTYVDSQLATKASTAFVTSSLLLKADVTYVDTQLGNKVDSTAYNAALATKLDASVYNTGIVLKADKTYVDTALSNKVDTTTYTTGLALKADASSLSTKLDKSGGTLTGKVNLSASSTSSAGLNLGVGTAPTAPSDGDMWATSSAAYVQINGSTVQLGGSGNITLSGDVLGSGSGAFATALSPTGVTAGTYKSVTVDVKGRVTSGTNPTTLSGYGITDAQPLLSGTGLVKSTAGAITYDSSNYLTANQSITVSGDATGSGTNAIALTLANSGVSAGTYTKTTVDAKGRVTSGTNLAATDIPNLDWSKITTGKPTTLSGFGIVDAQSLNANLTSVSGLSTSTTGLVKMTNGVASIDTSSYLTSLSNSAVLTAIGFTPVNKAGDTMSGALTINSGAAGTPLTLNTTNASGTVQGLTNGSNSGFIKWDGSSMGLVSPDATKSLAVSNTGVTVTGNINAGGNNVSAANLYATNAVYSGIGGTTSSVVDNGAVAYDFLSTPSYTGALARFYGTAVTGNYSTNVPKAGLGQFLFQNVVKGSVNSNGAPVIIGANNSESLNIATTGKVTVAASTVTNAYLNLAPGSAPTTPVNGDMWSTSSGIFAQVNGSTAQLNGSGSVTLTGDVTGSGSGSFATTLANSGVTSGTYGSNNTVLTLAIDAKGRVTSVGQNAVAPVWSNITSKPTSIAGYGIVDAQTLNSNLTSMSALSTAATGLVKMTNGVASLDVTSYLSSVSSSNVTTALGYTPANRDGDTFTGKVITLTPTTSAASLNLPHGVAPTTPVNGDVWSTTSGVFAQINGATTQLAGSGGSYLPLSGGTLTGALTVQGNVNITATGFLTATGTSVNLKSGATGAARIGMYDSSGALQGGLYSDSTSVGLWNASNQIPLQITGINTALTGNLTVAGNSQFNAATRGNKTTLTYATTITPDFSVANHFTVTLTGNATLATPTNIVVGQSGCITIAQDSTGSRTLAYSTAWRFAGGTAPALTTTASAIDMLVYQVDTTGRIVCNLLKGT